MAKVKVSDIPNCSDDLPFIEKILSGIAKYISVFLVQTPLNGFDVTMISMICALAGCLLSVLGHFKWGFLCFFLYIMLDHCDGQVARYRGESGKAGVYIDSRVHFILEPLYFICIGIGMGWIYWTIPGVIAGICYLVRQTFKIGDLGRAPIRKMNSEQSLGGKINYILFDFLRINNPISLMSVAIFFDFVQYALWIYAVLFFCNAIYNLYKNYSRLLRRDIEEYIRTHPVAMKRINYNNDEEPDLDFGTDASS